ncbi:TPA: excinuclease ABC subunit C [Candidatus Wolfebacteria bacterium]|nr:excinuclease ABC subunit C [Candidatus Wolfebacteria bacterium]
MYYVYILKSEKDNGMYVGKTNNLQRRLEEHKGGHVSSTKSRRPLVFLECISCEIEMESRILEKEYKKGYKREEVRRKYKLV